MVHNTKFANTMQYQWTCTPTGGEPSGGTSSRELLAVYPWLLVSLLRVNLSLVDLATSLALLLVVKLVVEPFRDRFSG